MWLMDDVTICDVRAWDIRIWQINFQNFRVRKIWRTWFLDMGAFSWQNATYPIQFILTIYINSEKLMLPGRCAPVEFFSWKCGKLRQTAKSGYPALIWTFRTSLFSALSWNIIFCMLPKYLLQLSWLSNYPFWQIQWAIWCIFMFLLIK